MMSHLSNEQLDDILLHDRPIPDHLNGCNGCMAKFEHRKALANRVKRAYSSLNADEALRNRIHKVLSEKSDSDRLPNSSLSRRWIPKRHYPVMAAAAVLILAALPFALFMGRPNTAVASQLELLKIHHHNLSEHAEMLSDLDPESLKTHFEERLGYAPEIIEGKQGLNYCACRVQTYQGKPVGSYVVATDQAKVTVVSLEALPSTLGMKKMRGLSDDAVEFWGATCECCYMGAVRTQGRTYYALGETTHLVLKKVLQKLLPDT